MNRGYGFAELNLDFNVRTRFTRKINLNNETRSLAGLYKRYLVYVTLRVHRCTVPTVKYFSEPTI
jgi:hypothetical protein